MHFDENIGHGDIFKNKSRLERFDDLFKKLETLFKEKLEEPKNPEDIKYTFENVPDDMQINPATEVACFINATPDLSIDDALIIKIVNSWAKNPGYPVFRIELYEHRVRKEYFVVDPEAHTVKHTQKAFGTDVTRTTQLDVGMGFSKLADLLDICRNAVLVKPEEVSIDSIAPEKPRRLMHIFSAIGNKFKK